MVDYLTVEACRACTLYQNLDPKARKKHLSVPGIGPIPASIMVVGEAPGVDEADIGVPLVGASGKRFDMLIKQAGLLRDDLFLTNLLKHRPPRNRPPHVKEIQACSHFLEAQLLAVQPQVVVTLGRQAAQYFDKSVQLVKDHGMLVELMRPFKLIPMYHPAAALYDPNLWAVQVADWSKLKETISGEVLKALEIPTNYALATDQQAAQLASTATSIGFDLETTSPKHGRYFAVQEAQIVGYSVSWADGQSVYVGSKPAAIVGVLESPLYEKLCLAPGTRVLTAALTWEPIESLSPGQELIGIDEERPPGKRRRYLRPTTVLGVIHTRRPAYRITMADRTELIASDEHPWLARSWSTGGKLRWTPTAKLRPGMMLSFLCAPWETETSYEAGYIAGALDGEGSSTRTTLSFAQNPNPMMDYLWPLLQKRGWTYGTKPTYKNQKAAHVLRTQKFPGRLTILGSTRPKRLLASAKKMWDGLAAGWGVIPVESIEPIGEQDLIEIETTTHTFVAEGFFTHNCHNAKFEYGVLKRQGITLSNFQDTKLAAWMLQYHSSHLKALARQMLGRDPITYEQVTNGADMGDLDPADIVQYGAADSDNTRLIWPILRRQLKEAGMWELYQNVELPVIPVLHDMEYRGVQVDEAAATTVLQDIDKEIEGAYEQVYISGLPEDVAIGSTDQLAHALEKMGAPIRDRTDAKNLLKTDEEHLLEAKALGWMPNLIDSILYFKGMRKLRGYAASYLDLRGPDGRLHPDFVQSGYGEETSDDSSKAPVTGRFSCRGPNLQNQPKNDPKYEVWVHRLRDCLVSPSGWSLVSADVEQEEPRIMAFINQDQAMLADFAAGIPIYAPMGEIIYGRPIGKQEDPSQWFHTKTFFLALGYGADYKKMHEIDPQVSLDRAKDAYVKLLARYPGLAQHYKKTRAQLQATGQVRDWFNRRRLIPKVYAMNKWDAEAGYREGANFLIQAPAASVMKLAMRRVWDQLHADRLEARILITVHDELVVECPDHEIDRVIHILYNMTRGLMPIDLPVEIKVGKQWGSIKRAT